MMNTSVLNEKQIDVFLNKAKVIEITSLSYTTIWTMMRKGEFPQSIQISPKRIAWRSSDIEKWMNNVMRKNQK